MQIKFPAIANRPYLNVVNNYKHVGSGIAADGSLAMDAQIRAKSATAAFVPIAGKLFGAKTVSTELKLRFADALIFPGCFIMFTPG